GSRAEIWSVRDSVVFDHVVLLFVDLCVVLFLYLYVVLRDLHSFPTRRSSDLVWCWPRCRQGPRRSTPPSFSNTFANTGFSGLFSDRKSTRLNSSHSQISYAVFSMKKNNYIEWAGEITR